MIALVTAALPLVLKLIEFFIDKAGDNRALRKSFIDFVEQMQSSNESPRLKKSYDDQVARLKKKLENSK